MCYTQHAHAKHYFNLDLFSSAGMDGNINSMEEHNNCNEVGYACFQRQLYRVTGTECMCSLGGWRKKASGPITCGLGGRAVLSVSVFIHSDLEHQAQYSKTVVERHNMSNGFFFLLFLIRE